MDPFNIEDLTFLYLLRAALQASNASLLRLSLSCLIKLAAVAFLLDSIFCPKLKNDTGIKLIYEISVSDFYLYVWRGAIQAIHFPLLTFEFWKLTKL